MDHNEISYFTWLYLYIGKKHYKVIVTKTKTLTAA